MINKEYRNQALGHLFGAYGTARPTKYYVGLTTKALNADGGGITEPGASTSYSRVEIPNTSAFWNAPAEGIISNKVELKFPELTADANNAVQLFFSTSKTGNAIWWDYIRNQAGDKITRPLVQHGIVYINPGELKIHLENDDS